MSFPYVFHANFETGDVSEWDSETDTAGQLDIAHYSELARFPWQGATPYSGAYCMRLRLTGGTADAYLTEGDINIAANTNNFFRFAIWFSPDFAATANDTVNILELLASSTVEVAFGFRITASDNQIELGIGETAPTSFGGDIKKGVWYIVELDVTVDNAGNNDGTIDIYVHEADRPASTVVYASQVGSLDQGAITDGRLGVQDHLATTTGTILIDDFIQDDARINHDAKRFPQQVLLTKSGHAFVGPGKIANVSLLSGAATDNVAAVYDTDTADTGDAANIVVELKNTANNELIDPAGMPVRVSRGAYVELTGTDPRALVQIGHAKAHNQAGLKIQGQRRTAI